MANPIYARISAEIESGNICKATWTEAAGRSDGSNEAARSAYIQLRAKEITGANNVEWRKDSVKAVKRYLWASLKSLGFAAFGVLFAAGADGSTTGYDGRVITLTCVGVGSWLLSMACMLGNRQDSNRPKSKP